MQQSTVLSDTQSREFQRQWEIISRNTVDTLPEEDFKAKLANSIVTGTPLRIKQGFDPTSPDIHIGHAVGLRKLRQFQVLGHQIVLIVGDYTASVGDPSGVSSTRPTLSYEEIMSNAETYKEQFFRIVEPAGVEVHYNGDWFKKITFMDIMRLASRFTVARLLERDDFSKRMKANTPISIHELFYPLMQAYDSVAVKADVEIGATEQKFNLLAGRTIQEAYGVTPQCILTMPILVGTDGEKKMSKSLGNYIGVTESPKEMFGKVMSIPDRVLYDYFALATDLPTTRLDEIRKTLERGDSNPMILKKELGEIICDTYQIKGSGTAAREEFERIFSQKQLPDDIEEYSLSRLAGLGISGDTALLVHLLTKTGLTKSNGEGRRLIEGGGVYLGDEKVVDPNYELHLGKMLVENDSLVLRAGKRRFLRLVRG